MICWYLSTGCFYFCMLDGLSWEWYHWHNVLRPGGMQWYISVASGMEWWERQDAHGHPWWFLSIFLNNSVSLTDNATSYPLQLPPTDLPRSEYTLRRCVASADDFRMPDLSVIHKKSKQIQGLQKVWNKAVKVFTQMEEDIKHWHELLQLHQPGHNRAKCASFVIDSQQNAHIGDLLAPPQQHYQKPQPVTFQKISSLAGQTIYKYKHEPPPPPPPPPSRGAVPHPPPPTRFVQATGKYHPYNSDLNDVSRYPIVFHGCYACGKEDHNRTNDFTLNCSNQFKKRDFSWIVYTQAAI